MPETGTDGTALAVIEPEPGGPLRPRDPEFVGSYRILRLLGEGGMGTVYLGEALDGRRVAVKVIQSEYARDPEFRERFRAETAHAQQVSEFYTAEVLDADPDAALPYLVTEFVPGPTLRAAVTAGGPLGADDLARLAVGMAAALTAIHAAGIAHHDLKPGNVLLGPSGPRVIDFGIANGFAGPAASHNGRGRGRARGRGRGHDATQIGTPGYMAPEQAQGEGVGPAADVFAWAAVMTFAASGAPPFGEGSPEELLRRVARAEPDLSSLPTDLVLLVRKAFSKDPQNRPSAADLLLTLMGEKSPEQRTPLPRPAERRPTRPAADPRPAATRAEDPSAAATLAASGPSLPAAAPTPAKEPPVSEMPPAREFRPPISLPPLHLLPLHLPPLALPAGASPTAEDPATGAPAPDPTPVPAPQLLTPEPAAAPEPDGTGAAAPDPVVAEPATPQSTGAKLVSPEQPVADADLPALADSVQADYAGILVTGPVPPAGDEPISVESAWDLVRFAPPPAREPETIIADSAPIPPGDATQLGDVASPADPGPLDETAPLGDESVQGEDLPDISPADPLGLGDLVVSSPDVPTPAPPPTAVHLAADARPADLRPADAHAAAEPPVEDLVASAVLDIPFPKPRPLAGGVAPLGPDTDPDTDKALDISPTDPLGIADRATASPDDVPPAAGPAAEDLVDVVPAVLPAPGAFDAAGPVAHIDIVVDDLDDAAEIAEITVAEIAAAQATVAGGTGTAPAGEQPFGLAPPDSAPAPASTNPAATNPAGKAPSAAAAAGTGAAEAGDDGAPPAGDPAGTGAELMLAPRFDPAAAIAELLSPDVLAARAAENEIDVDGVIDMGPGWIQETGGLAEPNLPPIRIAELHALWDDEVDLDAAAPTPDAPAGTALALRLDAWPAGPGTAAEPAPEPAAGPSAPVSLLPAVPGQSTMSPEPSTAVARLDSGPDHDMFGPAPLALAPGSSTGPAAGTPSDLPPATPAVGAAETVAPAGPAAPVEEAGDDIAPAAQAAAGRVPGARARARAARRGAQRRRVTTLIVAAVVALLAILVPLALRSSENDATDAANVTQAPPAVTGTPAQGAAGSPTAAAPTPAAVATPSATPPASPAAVAPPDPKGQPGVPGLWLQPIPGGVTVTVIAPFDGGEVTSYRVVANPGGARDLSKPGVFQVQANGCAEVSVTVAATGPGGSSATSAPVKARSCVPPSEPRGLLAIPDGRGHLIINWDTPENVGGNQVALTYDLTIYRTGPNGVTAETVNVTGHSYTRTAPGPGDPYFRITLAARNAVGAGPAVLAWGQ